MEPRRLPGMAFVLAFLIGVLAKVWRAGDLWLEAGADDGFRWLPLGLGAELLIAGLFAALVALALRINLWLAGVVLGAGLGGELFWLALNDVSFRISQIGITWERLRGDEGVRVKDFNLMAAGDVVPAVVYAVVALAACVIAVALIKDRTLPRNTLIGATLVGGAVYTADLTVFSERNFGMGDNPVLLLARTWSLAWLGREQVRLPRTLPPAESREARLALLASKQQTPPEPPPPREAPSVKNAIVFFSEGVARKHTGLEGRPTTPHLMRALRENGGVDFTRYYSPYHKSIAAIYSMICSDFPPPNAKNIMEVNPRIDCGSAPEVMARHGVHPGLFHGGDFGFYDKLQLLGMRGFEVQKDARAIARPGVWEYDWGVDDRAVVDEVLAWIDSLPKGERFFAVIIPITAHYPYAIPPDVPRAFPGSSSSDRFASAVHFLDEAFGRLYDGLAQRGLVDDTAVAWLADHGETVAERPRAQAGRRLAYEPSLHVPLVLLAPSVFDRHIQSARVGSHVDLLPTLLDLMGLPADPRHLGQSLLSAQFEPRRVFIGANNGPKYIGFVDGNQKFILNRNTGLFELYDLVADPFEQNNVAKDHPELVARLAAEAQSFADGQLHWLQTAPKINDDVDVQVEALAKARVSVERRDGTRIECPLDPATNGAAARVDLESLDKLPGRRLCPGLVEQPFLGRRNWRAAGRTRDCVLVNVPEGGGTLSIDFGAEPWLPFLTRVRTAVQRTVLDSDDEATLTAFGDGKQGQQKTIDRDHYQVRVTFPSSQQSVSIRLSGERPLRTPVCIAFHERAWRAGVPSVGGIQTSPSPAPPDGRDPPERGPDEAHDDLHGKRP